MTTIKVKPIYQFDNRYRILVDGYDTIRQFIEKELNIVTLK